MEANTDNIQKDKEPPDKPEENNILRRYCLTMRAMKGARLNRPPPPPEEEVFSFEGQDWNRSDSGWNLPDLLEEGNEQIPTEYHSYAVHTSTTQDEPVVLNRCATKEGTTSTPEKYLTIQSDHGANANITDNLAALIDVHHIEPTGVASADKGSQLTVTAIGKLPLQTAEGSIFHVLCYYSANADGTLLFPNAMCA